ncbi:hypothetical protein D3C87_2010540 [compost metagenome]
MLLEMTWTFISWAIMPVAAVSMARMVRVPYQACWSARREIALLRSSSALVIMFATLW